jgi:hypothetical protein
VRGGDRNTKRRGREREILRGREMRQRGGVERGIVRGREAKRETYKGG